MITVYMQPEKPFSMSFLFVRSGDDCATEFLSYIYRFLDGEHEDTRVVLSEDVQLLSQHIMCLIRDMKEVVGINDMYHDWRRTA